MKRLDFINERFLIYLIKCLIGVSICYLFYRWFPEYRLYWSMVSVLLVISEDDMECKRLPISRMKANIIGSFVGLGLFLIHPLNLITTCVGVTVTIFICYILKLGAATRTALAALIIVMVQEASDATGFTAFERVGSVILGCTVAIIITFIFQKLYTNYHSKKNKDTHPIK
ncbi:MAG: aromatic acid exporter family protein [Cellulosilyticaceae bacterium]